MMIKVQLKRDVPSLGRAGQLVSVSQAYARNFLLPKGLAVLATAKVMAVVEQAAASKIVDQEKQSANLQKLKEKLQGATVTLTGRASPTGKLFAALKIGHVLDGIRRDYHLTVPPTTTMDPETLKTVGDHPVTLRLGHDQVFLTVHIDHAET